MTAAPLARASVVDTLAAAVRGRILDGELAPGTPLREQTLADAYDVSRHSLRAAFRVLSAEGLVRISPNRGAAVASLDPQELRELYELRTALEVEAAYLALERGDGRLPAEVRRAVEQLAAVCARAQPAWRTVSSAHASVHGAIVRAAESPRLEAAYGQLAAELSLFVARLRPLWPLDRMVSHHVALLAGLETDGPEALRRHLRDGLEAVLGEDAG